MRLIASGGGGEGKVTGVFGRCSCYNGLVLEKERLVAENKLLAEKNEHSLGLLEEVKKERDVACGQEQELTRDFEAFRRDQAQKLATMESFLSQKQELLEKQ